MVVLSVDWSARRIQSYATLATHGNDLHAAFVAFALALGDDAIEFRQRKMDDATVAGIHRFKGNDLAFFHSLLAQAASHARKRGLTAEAVTLGVNHHMAALQIGSIDSPVGQELERS
jgi:hypothetical protein